MRIILIFALGIIFSSAESYAKFPSSFCDSFTIKEDMTDDVISDHKRQADDAKKGLQKFKKDLQSLFKPPSSYKSKPRLFVKYDLGSAESYFQSKTLRNQLNYEFSQIFKDQFEIISEKEVIGLLKSRKRYSKGHSHYGTARFYKAGLYNDSHGVVVFKVTGVRLFGRGGIKPIVGKYSIKGKMNIHAEFIGARFSKPVKKTHVVYLDRSGTQGERELFERIKRLNHSPNSALVYDMFIRGVCEMRDMVQ